MKKCKCMDKVGLGTPKTSCPLSLCSSAHLWEEEKHRDRFTSCVVQALAFGTDGEVDGCGARNDFAAWSHCFGLGEIAI